MAQFSEADINEAKRRVMDMRNRASRYASSSQPQSRQNSQSQQRSNQLEDNIKGAKRGNENERENNNRENYDRKEKNNDNQSNNPFDALAGLFSGEQGTDSSFVIILVLIMILSREGADNKLILALLYLLL